MNFYKKKRRAPAINIVSLIDILAILLIFFIVTTTFKKTQPQFEINLPESKTATPASEVETAPLILDVKSETQITLDEKPITLPELGAALKALHEQHPDRPLAMRADRSVPFGVIVKVRDSLVEAGVKNIQTFTDPENSRPAAAPAGASPLQP